MTGYELTSRRPGCAPPDDFRALTEEIERTRAELGETVEALAARADVKARALDKAGQVTRRLHGTAGQLRNSPGKRQACLAIAAGGALLAGWLIVRRRR